MGDARVSIPTYIGYCCREWVLAIGSTTMAACGLCGETPTYRRPDTDNPDYPPKGGTR